MLTVFALPSAPPAQAADSDMSPAKGAEVFNPLDVTGIGKGIVLGSSLQAADVTSITFLDNRTSMPASDSDAVKTWDAGDPGEGSTPTDKVKAWAKRQSDGKWAVYYATSTPGRYPSMPVNASGLFSGFTSLTQIVHLDRVSTSQVTNMGEMFSEDAALTSVDVSGFDTSRVTDTHWMFLGCRSLSSLDLSGFDMTRVTYTYDMLFMLDGLHRLTVSGTFPQVDGTPNGPRLDGVSATDGNGMGNEWPGLSTWIDTATGKAYRVADIPERHAATYIRAYRVAYDANGADASGSMDVQTVAYGESVKLTGNGYAAPGRTFLGWNTKADGSGTQYADGAQVTDLAGALTDNTMTAETTLYAQWRANTYTVSFDANGGDGRMDAQTLTYGTDTPLTSNGFTRPGYRFAGWNTQRDGSGTSYADGQTVLNLIDRDKASVTMYAQWEAVPISLAFDMNGGEGTMASLTGMPGGDCLLPANGFMRPGYAFAGWNTQRDGSGIAYAPGATATCPTSGLTLYAQWKALPSRVDHKGTSGIVSDTDGATGQTVASSDMRGPGERTGDAPVAAPLASTGASMGWIALTAVLLALPALAVQASRREALSGAK